MIQNKRNLQKFFIIFSLFFFGCSYNSNTISSTSQKPTNDTWIGEPASGFRKLKTISAKKFMVSSANQYASAAGREILAKGGNAIDAAIATQLVLNVVEPYASGIGGGGFLLYYDAKSDKAIYFNGRETAPAKANPNMFLDKNGKAREFSDVVRGGLSVATPGLLKILKEAHNQYGKLPWADLFQSAIKIANDGFIVDERMRALSLQISYIKDFDETAKIYLDQNGQARKVGDIIVNPLIAKTLELIAKDGIEPFYQGKIAEDIVKATSKSKINPGYLSLTDLEKYQIKTGDLICGNYHKYKICSMPLPSSGGVTLLQTLGILENFNLAKMNPNSAKSVHLISEAIRLAYADRNKYLGDVEDAPIDKMLDKSYLKYRSSLINLKKAAINFEAGKFTNNISQKKKSINLESVELPSTTHISIVDESGSAVSLTSSIEYFFGSAISVDGFLLNNQLTDFSFIAEVDGKPVANRIEGGKQPRSSMSPTFVFDKNDKLVMVVGSPGGPRIIQFVLKTIIAHLDWKMDIQKAISLPNHVALNNIIELEQNTDLTRLKSNLVAMGHRVKILPITSGIHAITIDRKNKILRGGADPRRVGVAIGI